MVAAPETRVVASEKEFADALAEERPLKILLDKDLRLTDAGLVYRGDVGTDLRVVDFEQALSAADQYPIVAVKAARNPTGAAAFIGFVQSALARRIFTETGFGPP